MIRCRLCLTVNEQIEYIDISNDLKIFENLNLLLRGMIHNNDSIPTTVCVGCIGKLNASADFVKQCIESEKVLNQEGQVAVEQQNIQPMEIASDLPSIQLADVKSVQDIFVLMQNNDSDLIEKLQAEKLLQPLRRCSKKTCRTMMVLRKNSHYKGNYAAYCKKCRQFKCITDGTFFEKTQVSFQNFFLILWMWVNHVQCGTVATLINVTCQLVLQYFRFFRDICSWKLCNMPPKILGGAGCIVEVDESVITKRKYNRGKRVKEQWIFGMYEKETKQGVIVYVEDRKKETLLTVIQKHIAPMSIIWSDQWKGYCGLDDLGYVHETVNHSKEFKSSTGVCTNGVEGHWKVLKTFCRRVGVMQSKLLPEQVDEFMWRQEFRGEKNLPVTLWRSWLEHVKERYPVA